MMDVKPPDHLYKYISLSKKFSESIVKDGIERKKNGFDALEDILLHGKIYYSKPTFFNDPFELEGVRIRLSAKEREEITNIVVLTKRAQCPPGVSRAEVSRRIRENAIKDFAEIEKASDSDKTSLLHRCGYISLSATNEEKLMWAHYADANFGICLRLRCIEDDFYGAEGSGRIIKITYDDEIVEKEVETGASNEAYFLQASRKAKCWIYEEEYRVYRLPSTRKADDAYGNHDFNSALVDGVFFGLRTDEKDKERIKEIVAIAGHQISIFQAVRHPERLDIVFEPVDD